MSWLVLTLLACTEAPGGGPRPAAADTGADSRCVAGDGAAWSAETHTSRQGSSYRLVPLRSPELAEVQPVWPGWSVQGRETSGPADGGGPRGAAALLAAIRFAAGAEPSADGRMIEDVVPGPVCRCLLYTSPSPRDKRQSRMPSSA